MSFAKPCVLILFWATLAVADPSPDTLRRARAVGLRPEVKKGVTVYCRESADVGTRFKTKKCVDEDRLVEMIQQLETQRQQLRSHVGPG